jgi:sporulation protein YlmC with PRC-barrel domain
MANPLYAAVLSVALVASSMAMAQTTAPQPGTTTQPDWRSPQAEEIRASKLIGTRVRNSAGQMIGDINDIVIGKDGNVAAVVLGVGGFLGLGERHVAVSFESLQFHRDNAGRTTLTINATKETLKAAPEWKWSAEDRRSPTGKGTKPNQ